MDAISTIMVLVTHKQQCVLLVFAMIPSSDWISAKCHVVIVIELAIESVFWLHKVAGSSNNLDYFYLGRNDFAFNDLEWLRCNNIVNFMSC